VSWQSACCAVEALRAVCASALFASYDAGGSRRQRWQRLHKSADRIIRQLVRNGRFDVSSNFLNLEPSLLREQQDSIPGVGGEVGGDPSLTTSTEDSKPPDAEAEGGGDREGLSCDMMLSQAVDMLLRQVTALDACAASEPSPDDKQSDVLDRAFGLAEAQLAALSNIQEQLSQDGGTSTDNARSNPPWEQACQAVKLLMEQNDKHAPTAKGQAEKKMQEVLGALKDAEDRLKREHEEVLNVERQFGVARTQAEQFNLAQAAVARLQAQAVSGTERKKERDEELLKERRRVEEVEHATAETRKKCVELEQQVKELEKRLEKKIRSQIPAEEVQALRRTMARQSRHMASLKQQSLLPSSGVAPLLSGPAAKQLAGCWNDLTNLKTQLLLEQSGSFIVSLENQEQEDSLHAQKERLAALAKRSTALQDRFSMLLLRQSELGIVDVANTDDGSKGRGASHVASAGGPHFASVALTRFLRETMTASQRGPVAYLSVPRGVNVGVRVKPTGALPVLADLSQLQSIHQALLP